MCYKPIISTPALTIHSRMAKWKGLTELMSILQKLATENLRSGMSTYLWRSLHTGKYHTWDFRQSLTLLFGRSIKVPLEALMSTWTDEKPNTTILTTSKYVEELRQRLEMGWKLAVKNLKQAWQKHSAYFNRHTRD